jgi:hypothetical protein
MLQPSSLHPEDGGSMDLRESLKYQCNEQHVPRRDKYYLCSPGISISFVCFIRAIRRKNKLALDPHIQILVNKATCHPLRRTGSRNLKAGVKRWRRTIKVPRTGRAHPIIPN